MQIHYRTRIAMPAFLLLCTVLFPAIGHGRMLAVTGPVTQTLSASGQTLSSSFSSSAQSTTLIAQAKSTESIDIWWPTEGVTVVGMLNIKALVPTLPVESYELYWSLDGGRYYPLIISRKGYAHKETIVDTRKDGWTRGQKHVIKLLAAKNGKSIATKTITVKTSGKALSASGSLSADNGNLQKEVDGTLVYSGPFVTLDGDGIPYSRNAIWNSCIRNTIVYDSQGKPFNCRRYHTNYRWMYPDIPTLEFVWNSKAKLLELPKGIIGIRGGQPALAATLTGSNAMMQQSWIGLSW